MAALEEDEREEELGSLSAIFPELVLENKYSATLTLAVAPATPLLIRFVPTNEGNSAATRSHLERDGYPATTPPKVRLSSQQEWLPKQVLIDLEEKVARLWDDYGRCQIIFVYIDYLQQVADDGFGLSDTIEGCLVLPKAFESGLVSFDKATQLETFNSGTYNCGVCLEPKKGFACYKMDYCSHVFCKQCLQEFYNNAINEGDVAVVRCLDPACGKGKRKKQKSKQTLHPRELLAIGMEEKKVRRFLEMKRKKKLEADKSTVFCPRKWCQGPGKNDTYPPIPADVAAYISSDAESDNEVHIRVDRPKQVNTTNSQPETADRLAVCEKCQFAFCKVCYAGWHGPFQRCHPRDPNELSAEEKATCEYIRLYTSPCPYCTAPVQKTMGCNHMSCFNCQTHFCYLCGSWLDSENPYQHFNKPGQPCYQRLWELDDGDEGQAPGDGRGFAGGARGWEQMAIEAARVADREEADAEATRAQAEEDAQDAPPHGATIAPV